MLCCSKKYVDTIININYFLMMDLFDRSASYLLTIVLSLFYVFQEFEASIHSDDVNLHDDR